MSESINFSRIRGDKQLVFLNTGKLIGCESISITNNFGLQPMIYLGMGGKKFHQIPNSEQYADATINSLLINNDVFFQNIIDNPINLFIIQDFNDPYEKNYSLLSGYLNTYSAKYSIGQIPQITSSFRFTENAGQLMSTELVDNHFPSIVLNQLLGKYNNTGNYLIPNGNSIQLILDEINTNRVLNYDINVNVNRKPIYNIGKRKPKRVDTIYPLEVNCQFSFEMSNYNPTALRDLPQNSQIQDICINIFSNQENQFICGYKFKNMNLVSETYENSTNGNVLVNKQYIGYFNKEDNSQDQNFNELASGNLGSMGILFTTNYPFTNNDNMDEDDIIPPEPPPVTGEDWSLITDSILVYKDFGLITDSIIESDDWGTII